MEKCATLVKNEEQLVKYATLGKMLEVW